VVARAQQGNRVRRVAVILGVANNAEGQARFAALKKGMEALGWLDGNNVHFDVRYTGGAIDMAPIAAAEAIALAPEVIVANSNPVAMALKQQTRAIPIVFVQVFDPVNSGVIESLARPGGNITGFASTDFSIAAKWLQVLKEIAPRVTRFATLRDPSSPVAMAQMSVVQAAAASSGMELTPVDIRGADAIERGIDSFARRADGGLVVIAVPLATVHLETIIAVAARNKLPAIYPYRYFAKSGGLVSYGIDNFDLYRRSASYVDRILKGEKPADLPVQAPTRYELVINLKTAKALGVEVPATLLVRADEVIE
jgi:putative ABC transport system substrate-binding protein